MSDRDTDHPEMPENWGEYSRMLGDLPLRSLPSGFDGRLQARLSRATSAPRPARRWLLGGLSAIGCGLAVIAGIAILSPEERPAFKAPARTESVPETPTKRRHARRATPPRPIAPQVSEHTVPIDTNVPRHIPLENRQPEVTTGGSRTAP